MATVSLCMIVRNEEDVLGRCLDSVKGLVDEIILVDTGSTDRTKEIASRYTDRIYDFVWEDDFAAARNFSFSKASMDYQMWLDADDVILKEDGKRFLKMKGQLDAENMGGAQADIVMMKYHTAFGADGRPSMSYDRERLLKRANGYRWEGAVHEVVVPWGQILYSEAAVTHKKVRPSDPDRNLKIYQKLMERGEKLDPRHQFYYARELADHARYVEAAEVLEGFLKEGKGWKENRINACLDLSWCLQKLGRERAALQALFESFAYDLPRAEACCGIGAWFLEKKEYEQAAYWYQRAAECRPDFRSGGFYLPDCYDYIPYLQLCVCFDRMGDEEKARSYHEKAKAVKPDDPVVLYNESYFASRPVPQSKGTSHSGE